MPFFRVNLFSGSPFSGVVRGRLAAQSRQVEPFDVRRSDDVGRDLAGVDIARTAFAAAAGVVDVPGAQASARVLDDRPGRLVVDVSSSAPGLLVTTERFHEGWRVRAGDGRPLDAVRVNGDFLGCLVAAGHSTVALTFEPRHLRIGLRISAAALAAAALAAAVASRARSRRHG